MGALAVSLEDIGNKLGDDKIKALADCLNKANSRFLDANKNPSRKVKEIDTRGSHFYVALYWAQALATSEDPELKALFSQVADVLTQNEAKISDEMIQCQGAPMDVGGYYQPDD